jgi:hypothetical protein
MKAARFIRCFAMFATLSAIGGDVVFAQEKTEPPPTEHSFTAPSGFGKKTKLAASAEEKPAPAPLPGTGMAMPRFEFSKVEPGNANNIPPGFYATFSPPAPDTVDVFEGGTDAHETIKLGAGKEIIMGDSMTVEKEVESRKLEISGRAPVRKGKTNSMVTRSGFIPGQGFGTNRFRFAVRPGNFSIRHGAMISASIHMLRPEDNIGTILCAVTSVDYDRNTFTVEASNEIPSGESINWIIVNYPDPF